MATNPAIRELLKKEHEERCAGKQEAAFAFLEEARALALSAKPRENRREFLSEVENAYGNHHGRFSDLLTELRHRKRAVALLGPNGHPLKLAIARANLAGCYIYLGEYTKAFKQLHRSLAYYTKGLPEHTLLQSAQETEVHYLLHALYTTANLFHSLRDFPTCLSYLALRNTIEQKQGSTPDPDAVGLFASCYLEGGHVELSQHFAAMQLKLSREQAESSGEAMALSALALIAVKRGDLALATKLNQDALVVARSSHDKLRHVELLCNLADIEQQCTHHAASIQLLEQAKVLLDRMNTPTLHERIHLSFSSVYEATEDFQNALQHFKLATEYKEIVSNAKEQHEVARLRNLYERRSARRESDIIARTLTEMANEHTTGARPDLQCELLQLAPSLTRTEIKVCELLAIGASTKEIASQMNASRHTVDGHRTAIRKKLGIPAPQNLSTWLMALRSNSQQTQRTSSQQASESSHLNEQSPQNMHPA